ncbi:MAG: bacteriohemerythrin, partial [Chlorobi bacterium]|nr:bacteriohemerythrin [Chlorobiota bacterium]
MTENLINWNETYSVGNAEMDKQHKKLIEIINKLFKSFKDGNAQEILHEILQEMIDYANYHLNSEEKLLYKYDYPEKEKHEKLHEEFRN